MSGKSNMKAKLQNRLSVKVVLLTVLMASMTLLSSVVGITSLSEFTKEYEQVKNEKFNLLLKMTELKIQTEDVIHLSTEMLLSKTFDELQLYMLEVADKRLWIDMLFTQLTGHTSNHQELLILKIRLYSHLDKIFLSTSEKFIFSEQFFELYAHSEALKKESLNSGNIQFFLAINNAQSHFNPIVNKQLALSEKNNIGILQQYIESISKQLNDEELKRLHSLFLGENSLSVSYQKYANTLIKMGSLRLKNKEFTDLFVSYVGDSVNYVQERFMNKLTILELELKQRKQHLYLVVFGCLFVTVFLLFIQINFIRRVELIRKVISVGEGNRKLSFPINGKDEISNMALSVKSYIDRLVIKEQEILAINTQLEHLASHDGLTNIYNRRYFENFLLQENARYLRHKEVFCIAMIDLDFFKQVNDNYGHDAGDKILIEFTKRVLSIVRKIDVFARYGGEEFILLMPNTTEKDAFVLMERIRLAIKGSPYLYNQRTIPFTVSIGLLEVKGGREDDPLKQVSYADNALYKAKEMGRDRTCIFEV